MPANPLKIQVYVKKSVTLEGGRLLEIGYGEVRELDPSDMCADPAEERESLSWILEQEVDAALASAVGGSRRRPVTRPTLEQPALSPLRPPMPVPTEPVVSKEDGARRARELQARLASTEKPLRKAPIFTKEEREAAERELTAHKSKEVGNA